MNFEQNIISVRNLIVRYKGSKNVNVIDDVSFYVIRGSSTAIVGGSGSGKTTVACTIAGIIKPVSGKILFQGEDVSKFNRRELKVYKKSLQIIFQDTLASLNPRMTVGGTLREVLFVHRADEFANKHDLDKCIESLLDRVELSPGILTSYPHEISGGQRQRVSIARALAVNPRVLIADEPVSALDVAMQSQMLKMLARLVESSDLTMIFIAHDLAVVKCLCDYAIVMENGRIVETGIPSEIFTHPISEFTRNLVDAVPDVKRALRERV